MKLGQGARGWGETGLRWGKSTEGVTLVGGQAEESVPSRE